MRVLLRPPNHLLRIPSRINLQAPLGIVQLGIGRTAGTICSNAFTPPISRLLSLRERRLYHSGIPNGTHGEDTTIYALSTAPGRAAIAVIRISGPACTQIYRCLCPSKPLPKPRHATLRRLYTPHLPPSPSTLLDSGALILFFPGPNTVTGEDVLELHVHGGPAIVRAALAAIPTCAAPPANPSPDRKSVV